MFRSPGYAASRLRNPANLLSISRWGMRALPDPSSEPPLLTSVTF